VGRGHPSAPIGGQTTRRMTGGFPHFPTRSQPRFARDVSSTNRRAKHLRDRAFESLPSVVAGSEERERSVGSRRHRDSRGVGSLLASDLGTARSALTSVDDAGDNG
jgi:hypothetical protein